VKFGYFYLGFRFQWEQEWPGRYSDWASGWIIRCSYSDMRKNFLWNRPHCLLGPPSFLFDGYRGSSLGV